MQNPINKKLNDNLSILKKELGADESFDVIVREFTIGDKKAGLVFLDGFIKDNLIFILQKLMSVKREDISLNTITSILDNFLPFYEVNRVNSLDKVIQEILAGPQALLIDGQTEAIIIDARTWLGRTPSEPELEKATRGPADGFVETMLFNINAIRRRVRDPNFRAEVIQIGKRSRNDLSLVYIKDIVDKNLVKEVKDKLGNIDIDGLPLADKSIEEIITGGTINPLPLVRYTERPDNVAAHILEGDMAIIVDNSPTALIFPAPFFSHIQTLEVFRRGPVIGTYFSLLSILGIIISVLLPAVWLLMATNEQLLPESLNFIGVKEESNIGLGLQFILASIGIDLIRMASIQTPGTLATSLSLIGALLLGDFAVKVGLFSPETILYISISSISNFAIPGYEIAMVLKLIRVLLLLAIIIGNIWGFAVTLVIVFLWFALTKSFGIYYLWPLIPFDYHALKSLIVRQTVLDLSHRRPKAKNSRDQDRSVKKERSEDNK